MVEIVARVTAENRIHELICDHYRGADHYSLQTSVDGKHVAMRALSLQEAMEWCELAKRGGVVYGAGVAQ